MQNFQRKNEESQKNIWFYLSIRIIVIVEERGICVILRLGCEIKTCRSKVSKITAKQNENLENEWYAITIFLDVNPDLRYLANIDSFYL